MTSKRGRPKVGQPTPEKSAKARVERPERHETEAIIEQLLTFGSKGEVMSDQIRRVCFVNNMRGHYMNIKDIIDDIAHDQEEDDGEVHGILEQSHQQTLPTATGQANR